MKFTVKAAVGAALLSAASMSAFATSVTPPASGPVPVPGTVPGGLIVEAWDATTGTSLTEWLGGDISTFGAPSATPAGGETLDYGVLGGASTWSSVFTSAEIAAGNVTFTVSAANDVTPSAAIVDATLSQIGTIRNSAVNAIGQAQNTGIPAVLNAASGCNNVNPCVALNTSAPGYAVTYFGANLDGLATGNSAAGVVGGSSVGFYQLTATGGSSVAAVTPVAFGNASGAATWTLSASGDLVYSVPGSTAVPLPAAIWLLGSGLLGLAGIGRRKALTA
jgi:hypothetical protein